MLSIKKVAKHEHCLGRTIVAQQRDCHIRYFSIARKNDTLPSHDIHLHEKHKSGTSASRYNDCYGRELNWGFWESDLSFREVCSPTGGCYQA